MTDFANDTNLTVQDGRPALDTVGQTTGGQTTVDQTTVGQTTVGQAPAGQTSVSPTPTDGVPLTARLGPLLSTASSIVAPITAISTLLFYFGYEFSHAEYAFFGIDVDTIGLSTQDFVMRSPQPLLVPLLVLGLLGAAIALTHAAVRRHIAAATAAAGPAAVTSTAATIDAVRSDAVGSDAVGSDAVGSAGDLVAARRRLIWFRRAALALTTLGRLALSAGLVLLFIYAQLRDWTAYAMVTAVVLALGAALTAYGLRLEVLLDRRGPQHRAATAAIYLILVTSVFWATATLGEFSGRGSAHYDAMHLDSHPHVILDTKERLFLTSPGVLETVLPTSQGQTFHYRYRNLRLLIQGHDRLFLVPSTWSPSDSTLVVPMDGSVRVQFQFVNQQP